MNQEIAYKKDYNKIKFCCSKCGQCCENSRIRLSPFDILRICAKLNIPTMEFHQKYSMLIKDKENVDLLTCLLKTNPNCSFWEREGCKIYLDRPLGCRVYPLASQSFFDGKELKVEYYILEKCMGFGTKKRTTLGDFKGREEIIDEEEWVKFKTEMINVPWPRTEHFYEIFFQMCYNFDSIYFKEFLKTECQEEENGSKRRSQQIIKMARKKLLEPYQNG